MQFFRKKYYIKNLINIINNSFHGVIKKLFFLCLLVFSCPLFSQTLDEILIVSSRSGGAYQSFIDSFKAAHQTVQPIVHQSKLQKIRVQFHSLQDLPVIDKNALSNTLVVTVGVKAAQYINQQNLNAPVVYAMLPFSLYQSFSSLSKSCKLHSAVFINQPIQRQLNLSKEIFPRKKQFGVILGGMSEQRYLSEKKNNSFSSNNISSVRIHESRELAWSLRSLSNEVDMFIAINDPLVFNANNAKWLLYMAYQQRKPVIGFSKPYVSAGAAASVYSTPAQLGRQTAELLRQHEQQDTACLFSPQYPKYFKVAINQAVIKSLSGRVLNEAVVHKHLVSKEGER